MMPQLEIETISRQIKRYGHIIEGIHITMRCSQFEKSMLVIADDHGRVRIYDGDADVLMRRFETNIMAAKAAADNGLVSDFVRYQHEAELQRDLMTVIRGYNGTLTLNGKQISPNLPFNAKSVLPFVQLWAGVIGPEQYHIVGHEDGEVSWFNYQELQDADKAFGRSKWKVIQHLCPNHVQEIVVPVPTQTGLSPQRIPIRSSGLTHLRDVYATLRTACDQMNGVWFVTEQPQIRIHVPAKVSVPAQLMATPVKDWPFSTATDFVQAAVDATRDMV